MLYHICTHVAVRCSGVPHLLCDIAQIVLPNALTCPAVIQIVIIILRSCRQGLKETLGEVGNEVEQ